MADKLSPGTPGPVRIRLLPWSQYGRSVAVDYHMHTAHTDGTASAQEMADAATSMGIDEILFSEHVRHTSTYYPAFVEEIRALRRPPGLSIRVGVETKVLDTEGHLDCSPQTASLCDVIVGAVHSPPPDSSGAARSWSQLDAESALALEFQLALAIITQSQAQVPGAPHGHGRDPV